MRTTIGILGTIGLGVTVALGQSPGVPVAKPRAALLLPPLESSSDERPAIARGVSDDIPNYSLGISPVTPPRATPGLWGDSVDPTIRLAGGVTTTTAAGTVTVPAVAPGDDPSAFARGMDKLKGAIKGASAQTPSEGQPDANTPFRGTTVDGSTVYAGPPAYRWYGYGSVTPGANPFAPTGQSPKASANWYSITGATPGAFPVPVTSPQRTPGSDPPTYVSTAAPRNTGAAAYSPPVLNQPYNPLAASQAVAELPRPNPTVEARHPLPSPAAPQPINTLTPAALPPPSSLALPEMPIAPGAPPAAVPSLPQPTMMLPKPSLPGLAVSAPPTPATPTRAADPSSGTSHHTQLLPPPSLPPLPPAGPTPIVPPTMPLPPEPLATKSSAPALPLPPPDLSLPPLPLAIQKPVLNEVAPLPTTTQPEPTPATLPVSVTDYQLKWQPTTEAPKQGEWTSPGKTGTPPPETSPTPTPTPVPVPETEVKQPSAADLTRPPIIARGQASDNTPDPTVALIKRICNGRAEGTDVRWTGTKRLSVCFECKTKEEAQQLVRDISARPELVPIRIDFCVLIK